MKSIYLIVFLVVTSFSFSQAQTKSVAALTEKQKIDKLIASVENLKGCQFYRNGTWYNAPQAASHLRMKVDRAGSSIKTARDFIDKIASSSSMTGEAYKIKLVDGKEISTRDFFNAKLKELEA